MELFKTGQVEYKINTEIIKEQIGSVKFKP